MKVEILEVDLGCDVRTIISEDMLKLTEDQKKEIQTIVDAEKLTKDYAEKKKASVDATKKALEDKILHMYEKLQRGPILVKDAAAEVLPEIPTSSAFVLRMKGYLRSIGGTHYLERIKDKYVLKSYMREDEEPKID